MTPLSAVRKPSPQSRTVATESWYEPFPFAAVRAPLLPIEVYEQLARRLDSTVDPSPLALLAIAIGSPQLFDALLRANPDDAAHVRKKFERYLIRMATRSTPYGAFAGVGLLRWGSATDLRLGPGEPRFRTRPDIGWLYSIIQSVETHPELRTQLRFHANTAIQERNGRFLLFERATGRMSPASGDVSVRASRASRSVLAAAATPIPYGELAQLLTKEIPGATPKKVDTLLRELWEQTFLLSTLRPPLTGVDPASYVLEELKSVRGAGYFRSCLEDILGACLRWDRAGATAPDAAAQYRALLNQARAVSTAAADSPLQTDMALPFVCNVLSTSVAREAARGAELLLRLSPWPSEMAWLSSYRQAFTAKYGMRREVPLLDLLNPQTGLGMPNHYNGGAPANQQRSVARAKLLTDLALSAIRDGKHIVELDKKTIAGLQLWPRDIGSIPQSLDLFINLAADSSEAIDRGEFEVVVGPNIGSDTAGKSLGRFADLLGQDAGEALSLVAQAEASSASGAVHAELTYLPQSLRAANVTVRPTSRRYEIAVDLPSSVDPEHTIHLKDLLVGIDNGRFYVRSAVLNAQIIPCQSHMLNSMRAPAACRFLTDVARDGIAQLASFDWGPAAAFTFLPRVVVGRVVLRVAQWKIDGAIAESLREVRTAEEFRTVLEPWLAQWRVPRHIYLASGDNRLLIDLDDPGQIEHIRSEVCSGTVARTVLLDEVYPSISHAWLNAPHGRHLPELVVSLKRTDVSRRPPETLSIPAGNVVPVLPFTEYPASIRLQPPGSEWLMVKIYAAPAVHDQILTSQLYPFAESALSNALARDWFFIRYSDPEPHLRLRFCGQPETLMQSLYPEVCRWAGALMKEGLVSKYVFDTYERELDRYGGIAATTLAESLFAADSRATCRILQMLATKALRLDKTLLGLVSLDALLEGLGLLEPERLDWLRARTQSRMDLGPEYRTRKETFRLAIGVPAYLGAQFGGEALQQILDERRFALTAVAEGLKEIWSQGGRSEDPGQIYSSFMHMHFNRLNGSDAHGELRLLTLLRRTRESLKHATPTPRFAIP